MTAALSSDAVVLGSFLLLCRQDAQAQGPEGFGSHDIGRLVQIDEIHAPPSRAACAFKSAQASLCRRGLPFTGCAGPVCIHTSDRQREFSDELAGAAGGLRNGNSGEMDQSHERSRNRGSSRFPGEKVTCAAPRTELGAWQVARLPERDGRLRYAPQHPTGPDASRRGPRPRFRLAPEPPIPPLSLPERAALCYQIGQGGMPSPAMAGIRPAPEALGRKRSHAGAQGFPPATARAAAASRP